LKRVLLLNMPFHGLGAPSLGLSLLKADLEGAGFPCDVFYLNLAFFERVCRAQESLLEGLNLFVDYRNLGMGLGPLADWIFSADLFGEPAQEAGPSSEEIVARLVQPWPKPLASDKVDLQTWSRRVLQMRSHVAPFLEESLARIDWELYDIIGFPCMFQQKTASLALARRVKARYPEKTIVFGGANCEQEMGEALHRLFPFVDIVCSGKADWVLPELVRRLRAGDDIGSIPNLAFRRAGVSCSTMRQPPLTGSLDDLPYPDHSDYFSQLEHSLVSGLVKPVLPFESARGCWWGQRSHCTFCGLNGANLAYTSKSPERALAELAFLSERYQVRTFDIIDCILDMRYFRTLLPALKASHLGLQVRVVETKANLSKEQVRLLAEAGMQGFNPGIESLSTSILRLMRKGTTCLQNIQLLKWAREAGLQAYWNLLVGFPGEDPAEYRRMAEIVPALVHLEPPRDCRLIRLDRFSRYYDEREALGVCKVRPPEIYRSIYPFPDEDVAELASAFDFDYADGRDPSSYVWPLVEAVAAWRESREASLTYTRTGSSLLIRDARGPAVSWVRLTGPQRAVYEFCDAAHALPYIEAQAREACEATHEASSPAGEPAGASEPQGLREGEYSRAELERLLAELVDLRLMLHDDSRYLSLATCA
jgi:ribosomal peptide maturation radical SAM protein 1